MTKQHLLLVDGDPGSLRTLEASLRTAGFAVTTARDGEEALARCRTSPPDLIVSDTAMPGMDGFELCRRLKADERLRNTPFIFLTGHRSVDEKVRGLELGVEDYLTKPIAIRELVTRIRLLVEKKERERLGHGQRASLAGSLADMTVADLVQTLEIGRKSGVVRLEDPEGRSGTLWLRDGRVVDCAAARLRSEAAFHRLLTWKSGRFAIDFGPVDQPARVSMSTQHLLIEGMRRIDEWGHTLQRIPPLDAVLQIDYLLLSERLAEIPDEVNATLKLVDGRRTIAQVFEDSDRDDLVTAAALAMLHREHIVAVRSPVPSSPIDGTVDWFAGPSTAEAPPTASAADPSVREQGPGQEAPPHIVRFSSRPRRVAGPSPAAPTASAPLAPAPEPALPLRRRRFRKAGAIAAAVLAVGVAGILTCGALSTRSHARSERADAGMVGLAGTPRPAIDLDPADAAAYIALARGYMGERRVEEAKAAYQRYLAVAPQGSDAPEARAALTLAP